MRYISFYFLIYFIYSSGDRY